MKDMHNDGSAVGKMFSGLVLPMLLAGLGGCGPGNDPITAVSTTTTAVTTTTTAAATTSTAATTTTGASTTTTAAGATTITTSAVTTMTLAVSGDSGDCTSDALVAAGATYQLKMRTSVDGVMQQESTNDYLVATGVAFEGHSSVEVKINTTVTAGAGVGVTNIARDYLAVDPTQTTTYGLLNSVTAFGFTVDTKSVFSPAIVWPRTQSVNGSATQTFTTTTTSPGIADLVSTQTEMRTYLGKERVTVAAGSFNACKFQETTTPSGGTALTATNWMYAGGSAAGTLLKSSSTSAGKTTVTEILSATILGAPLPAN